MMTTPPLTFGLRPARFVLLIGGVGVVFLLMLALGSVAIPLDQLLTILVGGDPDRASWTNIVLKVRLPRALTALLAGGALGIGGLLMQTLFRNPLADPFILGISSGASLGVALVVLAAGTVGGVLLAGFGIAGDLLLALAAATGASLTLLLVMVVAARFQNSLMLLILGLMIGYLVSALVSLLMNFAVPERIQSYVNWTFGSFGSVTWSQMPILAGAVIIGISGALLLSKTLNALLLGTAYAESMGVDPRRARLAIVVVTALLAGAVTAFCGPIGFIGVAVPHLCRALFNTSDHRALLPAVMLMGGGVAMIAALIAEVPGASLTLPLNTVTALIGVPVVIAVIVRQRNLAAAFAT